MWYVLDDLTSHCLWVEKDGIKYNLIHIVKYAVLGIYVVTMFKGRRVICRYFIFTLYLPKTICVRRQLYTFVGQMFMAKCVAARSSFCEWKYF